MDRLQDAKLMKFSIKNLDENLLIEILARLPSRTAIRLKLVCKSWCFLISSQYFITLFNHRRHDTSLPPIHDPHSPSSGFIFQSQFDRCLSIVSCGYTHTHTHPDANLCGFRRLDLSFLPCPQGGITVVRASCGDLILCSTNISQTPMFEFYVCNLLTKQWAALPPAPQLQFTRWVTKAYGILCLPAPCSLCTQCVDNSRYNFVVVRICVYRGWYSQVEVHLFSSEEGQWKTLLVPVPRRMRVQVRSSISLVPYKGMLHWLTSDFILVYDPYICPEKFSRLIDMPNHMMTAKYQSIGIFQDRLRVTRLEGIGSEYPIHHISELEDYNMEKWSLVHKIYVKRILHFANLLDPDLDPKIRETGFRQGDGSAFYWTDSVGWSVSNGIAHWITEQWWPTPVPPPTCTIKS